MKRVKTFIRQIIGNKFRGNDYWVVKYEISQRVDNICLICTLSLTRSFYYKGKAEVYIVIPNAFYLSNKDTIITRSMYKKTKQGYNFYYLSEVPFIERI